MSKGEGVIFFQKKYFVRKHIFAIDNQENTTICLLQPKFWGSNDLCMNNGCIIFLRFITIVTGQVSLTATVTCNQYYLLSCGADGAR